MSVGLRLVTLASILAAGCDEGKVRDPAPQVAPAAIPAAVAIDAAPQLFGVEPATLGPALAGLALGQQIDQKSAVEFLKQRGIAAMPFVRDGRLVSLRFTGIGGHRWPDGESWFDAKRQQHATEILTEQGSYLQFDLEVPIDQWLNTTLDSIVPLDLVVKSMEDAEARLDNRASSNYVDGHASVAWTDSALAGATTATDLYVGEQTLFRNTKRTSSGWEVEPIPGAKTHGVYVSLDAPVATYEVIEQHLTRLFGKPSHDRKTNADTWKHPKIRLLRGGPESKPDHIELSIER